MRLIRITLMAIIAATEMFAGCSNQGDNDELGEEMAITGLESLFWIKGAEGESCDAACATRGGSCVEDELNTVDSAAQIEAIARAVGTTCTASHGWSYSVSPGQCTSSRCCGGNCVNICAYGTGASPTCAAKNTDYSRFCPCTTGECIPRCAGLECGDDGCGGSCGTCDNGETCTNGQCVGNALKRGVMPQRTGNYLIIANPQVVPWLTELIEYRSEDYRVHVANTAEIGNTKEAIKNYIQNQYNNPDTRPEFLLLAIYRGENRSSAIPWYNGATYYTWESGNTEITSYYWYSLIAGNDLIPDVYLGLFSVLNQTEVNNAVRKIKETEANGYYNPKNVGYFMSLGWDRVAEWAPMVNGAGYSYSAYHVPEENTQEETTAEFVNLMDHELNLFYLNGHGAPSGLVGIWAQWAIESNVQNTVYPLAFTGACNSGNWYLNQTIYNDVFTEAMVFRDPKLAVAMLANSHYGGHYDEPMYHEIFRSHLVDGVSQVGPLVHLSKIKTLDMNHTDGTPFFAFNQEMVHLWGDPATELHGRASARAQKLVHVVFGSGDGFYAPGETVSIHADIPQNNQAVFSHWTGDTHVIADPYSQSTVVHVPDDDVMIEAVYEITVAHRIPGIIEGEDANERQGGIPIGQDTPAASLLLPGNTHNYIVDVETSGEYRCEIQYATQYLSGVVSIRNVNSDTPFCSGTLPVQGPDKWYIWGEYFTQTLGGTVWLPAGRNVVQFRLDSGTVAYDWLRFTLIQ